MYISGKNHFDRFLTLIAVLMAISLACAQAPALGAASDAERLWLESLIQPIDRATAHRFNVIDDAGNVMNGTKVIADPQGGYLAVYHWYNGSYFTVGLAQSTDLMNWHYVCSLGTHASQPYIFMDNNGGYVVAWEQDPSNHCYFEYFTTRSNLLSASPSFTYSAPRQLTPTHAEGTPSVDYVKWNGAFGDITHSSIYVEFHYYKNGVNDKHSYATLTNFNSWSSSTWTSFDNAIQYFGYQEIGQTDKVFTPQTGCQFDLAEATLQANDWPDWRVFVYDFQTGNADKTTMTTPGGSTSFANPRITQLVSPTGNAAYLVSLFIPSQGGGPGEPGGCLYYVDYSSNLLVNGDFEEIRPDNNPPVNWRFFAVNGASGNCVQTSGAGQYSSGLHGVQLTYDNPGVGDSAIDLLPSSGQSPGGSPAPVSGNHVYKLGVDARNASGQYSFNSSLQSCIGFGVDSYTTKSFGVYLTQAWQTFEMSAKTSASDNSMSVRFDLQGAAPSSAFIDNAILRDVTTSGNRVSNASCDNSTSQPLQWSLSSTNGATGSLALSSDANCGAAVALLTVASTGTGDIAMTDANDRFAVIPGEQLYVKFVSKKVSGTTGTQVKAAVTQYDSSGQPLAAQYGFFASPTTSSYASYSGPTRLTVDPNAATASIAFRIYTANGIRLATGAYLIDDVYVGRADIAEPVTVTTGNSKALPDGSVIRINGATVSGVWNSFFYVEADDRLCGIRVSVPSGLSSPVTGDGVRVNVVGTLLTNDAGERYIAASTVELAGD